MKTTITLLIVGIPLMSLTSCGGKSEETEEKKSTFGALKEFAEKAEELSKKEAVEPVSFQELKELLPETLAGIPRTEAEGQSNNTTGFKVSVAKGQYSNEEKSINLDIMDLGGIGGFAVAGMAAWTLADAEKENSSGYERTIKLDGHKGFEKYDNTTNYGELKLFYNERYLISLDAQNLSMDEIKAAYRKLDLAKLPKE